MEFHIILEQGYIPDFESKIPIHTFCGDNGIEGAFCPNCQKPLLIFMKLNILDSALLNIKNIIDRNTRIIKIIIPINIPIRREEFDCEDLISVTLASVLLSILCCVVCC